MTEAPASPYTAIVFDLDGTVVDSHGPIARTVNRVLDRRGLPPVPTERVYAMIGLPLAEIFELVLPPGLHQPVATCVDDYRALFDAEVLPAISPIPGATEAIQVVARGPWQLGVATGRRTDTAEEMLERCSLRQHFVSVLGTDRVPRPKPYPDVLLAVLEEMGGVPPEDVLVVGDSSHDVAMARAAGASVCAVTWGAQERETLLGSAPDWCLDAWGDLIGLLGLRDER